jgi:UDP-N-acetylmuramate dehydrogenase
MIRPMVPGCPEKPFPKAAVPLLPELDKVLPQAGARLQRDVPMSGHTTMKVGGPADIFFEPASVEEIHTAIRLCAAAAVPWMVLGSGSNIVVSDAGIRGLVLALGEPFSSMEWQDGLLAVQAGVRLATLAAQAARQGCAGLEFASGIPGTLGGAVFMNAGAYEHCMAEVVIETEYLDTDFGVRRLCGDEHGFAYRSSIFSRQQAVILRTWLRLQPDEPAAIFVRMAELAARRRATQPLEWPSAGSVFKRPPGCYAGQLISSCGLKGCRAGDAEVSVKHAGFIINRGQATADDIRRLVEQVQQHVLAATGIPLQPEIRFVGDWRHWPPQESEKSGEV